ncbi:MAG: carbohydrate kinase [Gammaproteobacteria bacterium HGW-Gammaproteobacteria-1]|jgi:fructokinase|nr:MAG: carbohydrate kinase [Gammaproteobacteria bacterium HGW-Gammaproteobacteria-1]
MAKNEPHTRNTRPLVFGEVLYDNFPGGERVLGGAPFNVAWHLQGFGLSPLLLTRLGSDAAGDAILEHMTAWGMDTAAVQLDAAHPTGIVDITLHNGQPRFHIVEAQAYDHIEQELAADVLKKENIGILYHGSLAARSEVSRRTLLWLRREVALPAFIDINLRPPWWQPEEIAELLYDARWLKLNGDELQEILPGAPDAAGAAGSLSSRYHLDGVIVTLGAQGALLLHDRQRYDCAAAPVPHLVDTVGAGDAFSAVVLLGLSRRWPVERMMRRAAEFAAAICGRRGATVFDPGFYTGFIEQWED